MPETMLAWLEHPGPRGTDCGVIQLAAPDMAIIVLRAAQLGRARVTRQGWKFLWSHYGLEGLLSLGRNAKWLNASDDERAAETLIAESLGAGYDPVSAMFGDFQAKSGVFELAAMA